MLTSGNVIPEGIYLYLIYGFLLVGMGLSYYWVQNSKAENKLELGLLAFWLATGSYYELIIKALPGLGFFESRPAWIWLGVFSFFLLRKLFRTGLRRWNNPDWRGSFPPWEIALYALFIFQTLSNISYLNDLGMTELFKRTGDASVVIILVLAVHELASKESFSVIRNAILFAAISTCIVSFLQLGVDSYFMRYGDTRHAFGDSFRSVGIYTREYSNSYFIIGGLIWALVTVKSPVYRWLLIGLFVFGVITTFHRMSYLICAAVFTIYFLSQLKRSPLQLAASVMGVAAIALIGYIVLGEAIVNSRFYKERATDRIDSRAGYWKMVVNNIGDKPLFGFNSTDNELYYRMMLRITEDRERATGSTGDIHNGYFQTLFFFGVPAGLAFTLYVFLAMLYFGRLSFYHPFFFVPLLFGIVYAIANLTNNFSIDKYLAYIAAIYFGLGMGARYQEDPSDLPETAFSYQQEPSIILDSDLSTQSTSFGS